MDGDVLGRGFTLAAGAVARVPWQLNLGGNGEGWGGLERAAG